MSEIRLAGLLCSKLCHDLVGPIGAIGNGIELMAEENDAAMMAEAVDLLSLSAGLATGRLKFYRLAFGLGGGDRPVPLDEAATVARELFDGSKVAVDWPAPAGAEVPKPLTRAVLNLIAIAGDSLIRGGRVAVSVTAAGAGVETSGGAPRLDPEIAATLAGKRVLADIGPREAAAYLARRLADEAGLDLAVEYDDTRLRFALG